MRLDYKGKQKTFVRIFGHAWQGGQREEKWSTKFGNVSTFQALCKTDSQSEL